MPHPNRFLRLDSARKRFETLVVDLCKTHDPADIAGLMLGQTRSLLLATLGPECTVEALIQVAAGKQLSTATEQEIHDEMKTRAYHLATRLGGKEAAAIFIQAGIAVLMTIDRNEAITFLLDCIHDLERTEPPKSEPEA